uniref:Uncharacterized protein n=1 Tax=Rhizophora mucronata TaxID=61149 RepID=A0A2P2K521_RHIMU
MIIKLNFPKVRLLFLLGTRICNQ